MNFFQHHIGDYSKDTAHLTMLEDAAYRRMLDVYYATEKPLPQRQDAIYRLVRARTNAEKLAVDVVLGEFFHESADGWHNKRADEEITKAHAKSEKAKGSAELRWQYERSAKAMPTQCEGNAPNNQEPRTSSQEPVAKTTKKPSAGAATRLPSRVNGHDAPTTAAWNAYAEVYESRWGVAPTRNKRVNGQLAQFITAVPVADAPAIAAFYVHSNRGLYVSAKHPVNLLLRDAEALRTEWLTGRQTTETEARQADQTAARGSQAKRLIAESRKVA